MPELTEERARAELDPQRPVVVYCYDTQCDLSARGAALLEAFGFGTSTTTRARRRRGSPWGCPARGPCPSSGARPPGPPRRHVRAGHEGGRPAATGGPGGVVLSVVEREDLDVDR